MSFVTCKFLDDHRIERIERKKGPATVIPLADDVEEHAKFSIKQEDESEGQILNSRLL